MKQRRKPQSIFCVCEAFASLRQAYLCSFFWAKRMLGVWAWGPSGNSVKERVCLDLVWDYGTQRACFKVFVHQDDKVSNTVANQSTYTFRTGVWGVRERNWKLFYILYLAAITLQKDTVNFLKPTGHVMNQQFNSQQLYVLPTLYLCVLYLSENKQRLVPLTA